MMNIKYRQLKAFALAARLGSFAQAAEAMAVTQPSLSVLIRELEHDLGMQLFERTTRSCRMTAAGASLFQEMQPVLRELEDVYQYARDISAGKRGRLAIATVPSLAAGFITKSLGEFQRFYPGVRVHVREELNGPLINAVKQDDVELGVAIDLSADADVTFIPLFIDRLILVAPQGHQATRLPITWQTLNAHPLILLGTGSAERALQLNGMQITPAFEVVNMATAVAMVRHRMGITIIPSSALEGLDMEGIHCFPMPGSSAERRLGVFHRSRKPLSVAAQALIDILKRNVPSDEVSPLLTAA